MLGRVDSLSTRLARTSVFCAQDQIDRAALAVRTDDELDPATRDELLADLAALASAVAKLINRLKPE